MLIEFKGYNGKPILIEKSKIMGAGEAVGSTEEDPITYLHLATGEGSEEWFIRESLADLRLKFDN